MLPCFYCSPLSFHIPIIHPILYPFRILFVHLLYPFCTLSSTKKGLYRNALLKHRPFRQMPILAMLYFYTCCVWRFFTFCFKKGMTSAIFLLREFFYSPFWISRNLSVSKSVFYIIPTKRHNGIMITMKKRINASDLMVQSLIIPFILTMPKENRIKYCGYS